jgi:hypothetical protein
VDATYRSDLRELNEHNFARFDAKLEQRIAELEAKFERRFAELDAKIDRVAAETREFLERRLGEQTRWLFIAWATIMVAVIGFGLRR